MTLPDQPEPSSGNDAFHKAMAQHWRDQWAFFDRWAKELLEDAQPDPEPAEEDSDDHDVHVAAASLHRFYESSGRLFEPGEWMKEDDCDTYVNQHTNYEITGQTLDSLCRMKELMEVSPEGEGADGD